jgi:uncharacterized protein (TIGR02246 family)
MAFRATILIASVLCHAEPCHVAPIQPTFHNLDFAEGTPGARPPGWQPSEPGCGAYLTEIAAGESCYSGKQCGVLKSVRADPAFPRGGLFQVVDMAPYRGKTVTFRADVRAEVTRGNDARIMVRVHGDDNSTEFFDFLGEFPITSKAWHSYEIQGPIADDARDMEFGLQLDGRGTAWIDNISITFADPHPNPDESSIRTLIKSFADARNAHDGAAAAALYSEDGEWFAPNGENVVHGHQALADLWGRLPGRVERTVQSIDFPGPTIAVVRVITQYAEPISRHHETFIAVKADGKWRIRIHQSVD